MRRSAAFARLGHATEVLGHLVVREWVARQRFTLLGFGWPLLRQLVQLAVLSFLFTRALDLGIDDYPLFVFTGLVAWSWFASGTIGGSWSLIAQRHLLLQPRTPRLVLPLVSVLVPALDLLVAIPVLLLLLLLFGEGLHATALLCVPLLALQALLMAGLAWLTGALAVLVRDTTQIVETGVYTFFYLTPVFYGLRQVPEPYDDILRVNPMAILIEAHRELLIEGTLPAAGPLLAVALGSAVLAVVGVLVFRRLQPSFMDEL